MWTPLTRNPWIALLPAVLIAIAWSDAAESPATQPSATVGLLSISVTRPLSSAAMKRLYKYPPPGLLNDVLTSLTLHLKAPDGELVGIDRQDVKVSRISDDKGTDLNAGSRVDLVSLLTVGTSPISADGHHLFVGMSLQKPPAPEATRIMIDGTISPLFAVGEKAVARQKLPMRVGEKIEFGTIRITVKRLQDIGNGKTLLLTLVCEGHPELLKQIQFFGPEGQEISSQVQAQLVPPPSPDGVEHTYRLAGNPSEVSVGGAVFLSTEKRPVPFHLDAGIGL